MPLCGWLERPTALFYLTVRPASIRFSENRRAFFGFLSKPVHMDIRNQFFLRLFLLFGRFVLLFPLLDLCKTRFEPPLHALLGGHIVLPAQ